MKKREFLKTSAVLLTSAVLGGLVIGCKPKGNLTKEEEKAKEDIAKIGEKATEKVVFTLPALGYGFDALLPAIDKMTMEIHHGKHHQGYVNNLNKALETNALLALPTVEAICKAVGKEDKDLAVRNNAGGHFNHSLYWKIMAPKAQIQQNAPTGALLAAINSSFGSVENLKTKLIDAAATRFGSGWAWLSVDAQKKLFISSTANQDNPLMSKIVAEAGTPILGIDVWEHAYYLNYQNKRKDYLTAFFDILRWEQVNANYEAAIK
jgi:Fe-Mn family superoxide dismutase